MPPWKAATKGATVDPKEKEDWEAKWDLKGLEFSYAKPDLGNKEEGEFTTSGVLVVRGSEGECQVLMGQAGPGGESRSRVCYLGGGVQWKVNEAGEKTEERTERSVQTAFREFNEESGGQLTKDAQDELFGHMSTKSPLCVWVRKSKHVLYVIHVDSLPETARGEILNLPAKFDSWRPGQEGCKKEMARLHWLDWASICQSAAGKKYNQEQKEVEGKISIPINIGDAEVTEVPFWSLPCSITYGVLNSLRKADDQADKGLVNLLTTGTEGLMEAEKEGEGTEKGPAAAGEGGSKGGSPWQDRFRTEDSQQAAPNQWRAGPTSSARDYDRSPSKNQSRGDPKGMGSWGASTVQQPPTLAPPKPGSWVPKHKRVQQD